MHRRHLHKFKQVPLIIGTNKNEGLLIKVNHHPQNFIFVDLVGSKTIKISKFHKTMNLNVEFHESILQGFFQRDGGDKSNIYSFDVKERTVKKWSYLHSQRHGKCADGKDG